MRYELIFIGIVERLFEGPLWRCTVDVITNDRAFQARQKRLLMAQAASFAATASSLPAM
jgi:hypothetical protein